ncbi:hypothetical protein [Mycolicibacterium diernhoferi]|nr:hypothetical protein [Mycolicibacterium diernhoferi]QYL23636.1 hypothetical protein K0O62_04755 [Mycolicibacterium diernhoferi]
MVPTDQDMPDCPTMLRGRGQTAGEAIAGVEKLVNEDVAGALATVLRRGTTGSTTGTADCR